jgi:hypothetical protein
VAARRKMKTRKRRNENGRLVERGALLHLVFVHLFLFSLKIIDADAHVPSSKEKNSSDDDEKPQIELHSKNSLEEARLMGKFSTATFKPVDTVGKILFSKIRDSS